MNREEISNRLKELLKSNMFMSLRNLVDSVNDDTSLVNDLALDSIQILELLVSIEKEFSFICEPNELDISLFDNFGSLITFIENKLMAQGKQAV